MSVLSLFEAECLVSKLAILDIETIGNSKWLSQHESLERLNIQCHQSAQSKHDEFVVNEIITQNKVPVIIYNLITLETWKEKIFPLIVNKLNENLSIKTYMTLYEEATLITMLQILLFHSSSIEESSNSSNENDDALLELVDYCHRKLLSIITNKVNVNDFNCHISANNDDASTKLVKQCRHLEFTICSCCVSIIRFITEHLSKTSISVIERVINKHEMIMLLITLVINKPWTKKTDKGIQKYNGTNKFVDIDKNNMFRLTKIEGELWLSIYNLLLDKDCANKYEITGYRKTEILKIKKYLSPQIVDQLPILKGLKRTLEELTIMNLDQNALSNTQKKLMIVEIVPEFRQNLLIKNFKEIAKKQLINIFNAAIYDVKDREKDMKVLCKIYNNFDGLEDVLLDIPVCSKCGQNAEKRCSRCRSEWYCSRECQVKSWKKHKKLCDIISKNRQNGGNDNDCKQQSNQFIKEIKTTKLT